MGRYYCSSQFMGEETEVTLLRVTQPRSDGARGDPGHVALTYSAPCKNSPGMTEPDTGPLHSLPCMLTQEKAKHVIMSWYILFNRHGQSARLDLSIRTDLKTSTACHFLRKTETP